MPAPALIKALHSAWRDADVLGMELFSWDDRYTLGHPQIDREHEALFALGEKLLDAMHNGGGKEVLRGLFDRVITYTQVHFAHEEALMNQHLYPGTDIHMAEHQKLVAQVTEFYKKFEADQLAITTETLQFLRNWLDHHIRQSDQLVVVHIRRRERALTHA
jgi:hemerythrin